MSISYYLFPCLFFLFIDINGILWFNTEKGEAPKRGPESSADADYPLT